MNWSRPHCTIFGHRFDVGRHAGHQHTGLLAVVETHRLTLHLGEHLDP